MGLGNPVIHLSSLLRASKKSTALHEPQMFGRHWTRQITRLCQLTDRILTLEQHLHHPQTMRMGERTKTFGCSPQGV
jgi:hypothetical protein